jgi:peptide-methionine (R)-S-oxide reductase
MKDKIVKSQEEWKQELPAQVYEVCRLGGTEPPFSGRIYPPGVEGLFRCACCGNELFTMKDHFDSGSGWPSFTRPVSPDHVEEHPDTSQGMERTEVRCARCDAHLGHVFPDGPEPTGLRYCINDVCLDLRADEEWSEPTHDESQFGKGGE